MLNRRPSASLSVKSHRLTLQRIQRDTLAKVRATCASPSSPPAYPSPLTLPHLNLPQIVVSKVNPSAKAGVLSHVVAFEGSAGAVDAAAASMYQVRPTPFFGFPYQPSD